LETVELQENTPLRLAREAMGTRFEILIGLAGPAGPAGHANRLACAEAALDEIESLHRTLSAFRRDSVLSYINENAAAAAVCIDPAIFELLALCREVHGLSRGAFDPSVGVLMEEWGFRGEEEGAPDEEALAEARGCLGFDSVILDEKNFSVRFEKPGLRLDLGGIAKGFGLDEAARIVRDEGAAHALIHGGTSTVLALGKGPAESAGWTIAIRDPRPGEREEKTAARKPRLLARVRLCDRALSVSAPHGRIVEKDGRKHGHLMDPGAGAPAEGVLLAAAISTLAARADAWSTAFAAAGPERFDELVERADGIEAALILHGPAGRERLEVRGPRPDIFNTQTTIKE